MARLNYVELPVASVAGEVDFYREALGWEFTAYGPDYAACEQDPCQLGLNGVEGERSASILPVIEVGDLEATLAAVTTAGGTITRAIFAFPGGRRFHFRDPAGLELAAYQVA